MDRTYWRKQESEPLFPDLIWSRPEQKAAAGKLLVIGGNLHAFAAPAEAYNEAEKAGAGTVRVILPDATKKIVGKIMEHVEYAPSTPSGSFSQRALAELLELAAWSDGTFVSGDLGRNSETAILLERFLEKYPGPVTLTKDAADYVITEPKMIHRTGETLLVLSFAQVQKLAQNLGFDRAFTFDMDLINFIEALHEFTLTYSLYIVTKHHLHMFCAGQGNIISTRLNEDAKVWRVRTAAYASVWWMQNTPKPLEALATAIFETQKK